MAKDCSFDVVSEFDKQELVNAVDQVKRDLTSRFDLKNSNSSIDLEADKAITITTNDEMKLRNIFEILQSKLIKRGISIKILDAQTIENALGGNVRQVFNLKKGLTQDLAKKIVADIKDYIDTYYEPFCGGCSVLFQLLHSDKKFKKYVACQKFL